MVPEEPGHQFALTWYRQALIDDEVKTRGRWRKCAMRLMIRMSCLMALEAQVMSGVQAMMQTAARASAAGQPQKTDKQKRDDQRHAQMGGGSDQGKQPRPKGVRGGKQCRLNQKRKLAYSGAVAAGSKILPGLSPEEAKNTSAAIRRRNYRNGKSLRR